MLNSRRMFNEIQNKDEISYILRKGVTAYSIKHRFYLRALRTCSPKYSNDEFNYRDNTFLNFLYPKTFNRFLKSHTLIIQNRYRPRTNINAHSDKINLPHAHITLPNNSSANNIGNNLTKVDIKTDILSSKTISDKLHSSLRHNIVSDAGVYCFRCKDCKSKYTGETSINIHKRLYKHRREIRVGNLNNTFLKNIFESYNNFSFNATTMLAYIHNKRLRRIFEAGAISLCWSINNHWGFICISP